MIWRGGEVAKFRVNPKRFDNCGESKFRVISPGKRDSIEATDPAPDGLRGPRAPVGFDFDVRIRSQERED